VPFRVEKWDRYSSFPLQLPLPAALLHYSLSTSGLLPVNFARVYSPVLKKT
jgi:hypothetical protein